MYGEVLYNSRGTLMEGCFHLAIHVNRFPFIFFINIGATEIGVMKYLNFRVNFKNLG